MSTMSLAISGTSIRQDSIGRFCLNDLHKAAGAENKHRPSYWLELQGTKDLIEFLETENPIADITAIFAKQGLGTFAVKELVYSYAMWISAKFHIAVIRAYDSQVNPKPNALREIVSPFISEKEAYLLSKAITSVAKGASSQALYTKLYGGYGITSYKNVAAGKLNEALTFLGLRKPELDEMVLVCQRDLAALEHRVKALPPVQSVSFQIPDGMMLVDEKRYSMLERVKNSVLVNDATFVPPAGVVALALGDYDVLKECERQLRIIKGVFEA